MWDAGNGRSRWNSFDKCHRKVCDQNLLILWGCWMHVPAWLCLKRSGVFITRSFKLVWSQMSLWGIVWLICMQNVGALRMLGQCSRTWHLEMWWLGMPYWEDVLCMGMLGKLLNILNRCVKKVYTQMISLLFVFGQPVAMQVWWMKPCTCMLQWSETTGIIQNWNITTAWLTFLAVLTIYRRQRIWYWKCPTNHRWLLGWLCLVLAEFMVMWRWRNMLPNEFLKWSLKMLLVMCCYQHLCCCWQQVSLWECWTVEKGKRCKETAGLHLDWSE